MIKILQEFVEQSQQRSLIFFGEFMQRFDRYTTSFKTRHELSRVYVGVTFTAGDL
jgi:hypothetical protein